MSEVPLQVAVRPLPLFGPEPFQPAAGGRSGEMMRVVSELVNLLQESGGRPSLTLARARSLDLALTLALFLAPLSPYIYIYIPCIGSGESQSGIRLRVPPSGCEGISLSLG